MSDLVCKIELNKAGGITIFIDDSQGKKSQMIHLDGSKITTTCKDQKGESKIEQTPEKITIDCKEFVVNSEKITCTSEKLSTYKSNDKFNIESKSDISVKSTEGKLDQTTKGNMTLKSSAEFKAEAQKNATVESKTGNLTAKAKSKVTNQGANIDVKATSALNCKGANITIKGNSQVTVSGTNTKVEGKVGMDVKGNLLNVDGKMTNVKGAMVKIG